MKLFPQSDREPQRVNYHDLIMRRTVPTGGYLLDYPSVSPHTTVSQSMSHGPDTWEVLKSWAYRELPGPSLIRNLFYDTDLLTTGQDPTIRAVSGYTEDALSWGLGLIGANESHVRGDVRRAFSQVFGDANSPDVIAAAERQRELELADKEVIDRASFLQLLGVGLGTAPVDLALWIDLFLTKGALKYKRFADFASNHKAISWALSGGLGGGAGAVGREFVLARGQTERSDEEVWRNIAVESTLGFVLGGGIGLFGAARRRAIANTFGATAAEDGYEAAVGAAGNRMVARVQRDPELRAELNELTELHLQAPKGEAAAEVQARADKWFDKVLRGENENILKLVGLRRDESGPLNRMLSKLFFLTPNMRVSASVLNKANQSLGLFVDTALVKTDASGKLSPEAGRVSIDRAVKMAEIQVELMSKNLEQIAADNKSAGGLLKKGEFDSMLEVAYRRLDPIEAGEFELKGPTGNFPVTRLNEVDVEHLAKGVAEREVQQNVIDEIEIAAGKFTREQLDTIRELYREKFNERVVHRVYDTELMQGEPEHWKESMYQGWVESYEKVKPEYEERIAALNNRVDVNNSRINDYLDRGARLSREPLRETMIARGREAIQRAKDAVSDAARYLIQINESPSGISLERPKPIGSPRGTPIVERSQYDRNGRLLYEGREEFKERLDLWKWVKGLSDRMVMDDPGSKSSQASATEGMIEFLTKEQERVTAQAARNIQGFDDTGNTLTRETVEFLRNLDELSSGDVAFASIGWPGPLKKFMDLLRRTRKDPPDDVGGRVAADNEMSAVEQAVSGFKDEDYLRSLREVLTEDAEDALIGIAEALEETGGDLGAAFRGQSGRHAWFDAVIGTWKGWELKGGGGINPLRSLHESAEDIRNALRVIFWDLPEDASSDLVSLGRIGLEEVESTDSIGVYHPRSRTADVTPFREPETVLRTMVHEIAHAFTVNSEPIMAAWKEVYNEIGPDLRRRFWKELHSDRSPEGGRYVSGEQGIEPVADYYSQKPEELLAEVMSYWRTDRAAGLVESLTGGNVKLANKVMALIDKMWQWLLDMSAGWRKANILLADSNPEAHAMLHQFLDEVDKYSSKGEDPDVREWAKRGKAAPAKDQISRIDRSRHVLSMLISRYTDEVASGKSSRQSRALIRAIARYYAPIHYGAPEPLWTDRPDLFENTGKDVLFSIEAPRGGARDPWGGEWRTSKPMVTQAYDSLPEITTIEGGVHRVVFGLLRSGLHPKDIESIELGDLRWDVSGKLTLSVRRSAIDDGIPRGERGAGDYDYFHEVPLDEALTEDINTYLSLKESWSPEDRILEGPRGGTIKVPDTLKMAQEGARHTSRLKPTEMAKLALWDALLEKHGEISRMEGGAGADLPDYLLGWSVRVGRVPGGVEAWSRAAADEVASRRESAAVVGERVQLELPITGEDPTIGPLPELLEEISDDIEAADALERPIDADAVSVEDITDESSTEDMIEALRPPVEPDPGVLKRLRDEVAEAERARDELITEFREMEPNREKVNGAYDRIIEGGPDRAYSPGRGLDIDSSAAAGTRQLLIADKHLEPWLLSSSQRTLQAWAARDMPRAVTINSLVSNETRAFMNRSLELTDELNKARGELDSEHISDNQIKELHDKINELHDGVSEIAILRQLELVPHDKHWIDSDRKLRGVMESIRELFRGREKHTKDIRVDRSALRSAEIDKAIAIDSNDRRALSEIREEITAIRKSLRVNEALMEKNAIEINGIAKKAGDSIGSSDTKRTRKAEGLLVGTTLRTTDISLSNPLVIDEEYSKFLLSAKESLAGKIEAAVNRASSQRRSVWDGDWRLDRLKTAAMREVEERIALGENAKALRKDYEKNFGDRGNFDVIHGRIVNNWRQHEGGWSSALSIVRQYNYMRAMGSVALSSVPDVAMGLFTAGLGPYLAAIHKYSFHRMREIWGRANPDQRFYMSDMIMSVERSTSNNRNKMLYGLQSAVPEGVGKWRKSKRDHAFSAINAGSDMFSFMTGINTWNGFWKGVNATAIQSRLMRIAKKGPDGLSRSDHLFLGKLNVGTNDLNGISTLFDRYGEVEQTSWRTDFNYSNVDAWEGWEGGMSETATTYYKRLVKGAVYRGTDLTIITPTAGSVMGWSDEREWGRLVTQFKRFFITATENVTIPIIQRMSIMDPSAVGTMAGLGIAGGFVYTMQAALRGEDPLPAITLGGVVDRGYTNEEYWNNMMHLAVEALDRSGVPGVLSEVMNAADAFDLGPGAFINDKPLSRSKHRPISSIFLGPTIGGIEDLGASVYAGAQWANTGLTTPRAMTRMRRGAILQNLLPLRVLADAGISYIEARRMSERYNKRNQRLPGMRTTSSPADFYWTFFKPIEHRLTDDINWSNYRRRSRIPLGPER